MAASLPKKNLKVFFPRHCLSYDSGLMIGRQLEKENVFVVVTVTRLPVNSNKWLTFMERFSQLRNGNDLVSLLVLGIWINENHEQSISEVLASAKECNLLQTEEMMIACLAKNTSVPQLYLLGNHWRPDGCMIVLYKQPKENAPLTMSEASVTTIDFWRQLQCQEKVPSTELSQVLLLLSRSHRDEVKILTVVEGKDSSIPMGSVNFSFSLFSRVLGRVCFLCQGNSKHGSVWEETVNFLSCRSAGILQCCARFSQVKALCVCLNQPTKVSGEQASPKSRLSPERARERNEKQGVFPVVWFGSIVTAMLIDIIFGILIVSWIFGNGYNMHATDFVMEKTDTVVQLLSALLDWLKDAPAGLKLNKQLAEYLSTFFLYHIYLWQIYLSCIKPYLQIITSVVIMSGCFGVTFLLSMVSEVLSVITLHIYCFYVYAARLYNFQLKKLITLFRLFTGRRWNVEKNQVDSVPFKADRLFVGTLCFTVLFFLLPTTAMYYAVFTILRLIVLLVKGSISGAIDVMNNLPVFPLVVAYVRPDLIPGGVKFELLDSDSPGEELNVLRGCVRSVSCPIPSVCLVLHNQPIPIAELLCHKFIDKFPVDRTSKHSWIMLLGKLLKGELIYPWVKPRNLK